VEAAIASRLVLAAIFLLLPTAAAAAELYGKVIAVADGDTLTVLDDTHRQHRIRISGIDAPERRHGKSVLVVWHKRDRYERIVGVVLAPRCVQSRCRHTLDIGLEQIKAGYAWHYTRYAREQAPSERMAYAALEREARAQRSGLWQERGPVPPWDYRSSRHSSASPQAPVAGVAHPAVYFVRPSSPSRPFKSSYSLSQNFRASRLPR